MFSHVLPSLPYSFDALEPHIDALTMEIHHDRHHQAYIMNYTKLLEGTGFLEKYEPLDLIHHLDEVEEHKRQGVKNNLGGHLNHSFFWMILSPDGGGQPTGELADAINTVFGSFENFQSEFTQKAMTVFGSGWAWLVKDENRNLSIIQTKNQDTPILEGYTPLLGIDVWEHAYYLKHQNKRADYIASFWHVVNWGEVEKNFG